MDNSARIGALEEAVTFIRLRLPYRGVERLLLLAILVVLCLILANLAELVRVMRLLLAAR